MEDFWRQAWAVVVLVAVGFAVHEWLPDGWLGLYGIVVVVGFVAFCEFMPTSFRPFRKRSRRREL